LRVFYASDVTDHSGRSRWISFFEQLGEIQWLIVQTVLWTRKAFSDHLLISRQLARVGHQSVVVVTLISCTVGMVLSIQTVYQLSKVGAEHLVGALVSLSIARELGPLMTALLIAGRVGASMAAEMGTMKVQEEIDALRSLGIHPVRYLVMPRFFACTSMLPLLCIFAYVSGLLGGLFVSFSLVDVLPRTYMHYVIMVTDTRDLAAGLIKAFFFGMIIAVSACYEGLKTVGGAQEVGRATTRAVVGAFISILVADFFLTRIISWTPIG